MSIAARTSQPSGLRQRHHPECTCDPDTLDAPWKADLCLILHAEDRKPIRELLEEFASEREASVTRVVSRIQRSARLGPGGRDAAMSYFGQALIRMIETRWSAKTGPGTSVVFDCCWNLPTILEAETKSCIRHDRRRSRADGTADASQERV